MLDVPEPVSTDSAAHTTLRAIWAVARDPAPHVAGMFTEADWDIPLAVRDVPPGSLRTLDGKQIRRVADRMSRGERQAIVNEYRQNHGPPIILMGRRILDGHHRAAAAYLERRQVQAVQAADLPESDANIEGPDRGHLSSK